MIEPNNDQSGYWLFDMVALSCGRDTEASRDQPSSPTPQSVQAFVRTLTNKSITVDIYAKDTVGDLKAKIQAKEAIPPDLYWLTLDEKCLDDTYRLGDCDCRERNFRMRSEAWEV